MSKSKKKTWIAISGSMASGKSTLLKYLKDKGYPTYDCDQINAQLQQKHEKGYEAIVHCFGKDILDKNQEIDRKKLANRVFFDPLEREKLEKIMHPLILEKLKEIKPTDKLSFVEVPLLYELGWQSYFDEDWLVVSKQNKILERCINNRQMNEEQIKARLNAQMSIEEKIDKANVILYNNDSLDCFYQKIEEQLERIRNE